MPFFFVDFMFRWRVGTKKSKMKRNKDNDLSHVAFALIGLFFVVIAILVVSYYSAIWTIRESLSQALGLFAGAILTSAITILFIRSETRKDKEVSTYNIKIEKYASFVGKMYSMLGGKESFGQGKLDELRALMFREIVFYLDKDEIMEITNTIAKWKQNEGTSKKDLMRIVEILKNNLVNAKTNKDYDIYNLWKSFEETEKDNIQIEMEIPTEGHFWHFCMLDQKQLDYFNKHQNEKHQELSLIEYDESWRTEQLKKVKNGDIVFLFRRGGYGYIGVFEVIGSRLFDNRGKDTHEYVNGELQSKKQTQKDLELYDIYNSIADGATYCSNLIVTPLAYATEGVGYPGGVYRRTISRYDGTYAKWLLGRFLYMKNALSDGWRVKCDVERFESVLKKYEIQPSGKSADGQWKDNN